MPSVCALGQVCKDGACIDDPAPQMAQCTFDFDCNAGKGGSRCVNAYCLPTCTEASQWWGGETWARGTCRAGKRAG